MRKYSWLILTSCFRLPIHQRLRVPDHRPPAVPGAKRSHQRQTTWKTGQTMVLPVDHNNWANSPGDFWGCSPCLKLTASLRENPGWTSLVGRWHLIFGAYPLFQLRTVSFRDGISSTSSSGFWTSGIGSSQVSGGVGQVTKDFLAFKNPSVGSTYNRCWHFLPGKQYVVVFSLESSLWDIFWYCIHCTLRIGDIRLLSWKTSTSSG